MKKIIDLTEDSICEIKKLAYNTRKNFGVIEDVPIGSSMRMILDSNNITLCEYPFEISNSSHTDATITRFEFEEETMTFIGLNTSMYYDEQIFALAHELYHFITKTGKAYNEAMDAEDDSTERRADRFAAELLLPERALREKVRKYFPDMKIGASTSKLRILRFIATLHCEYWLTYRSIVNRLHEENFIDKGLYDFLYDLDTRSEDSVYAIMFKSFAEEQYVLLNSRTEKRGISQNVLETIIRNYEDDAISEDEFFNILTTLGLTPADFGFDGLNCPEDDSLQILFEGGESDAS